MHEPPKLLRDRTSAAVRASPMEGLRTRWRQNVRRESPVRAFLIASGAGVFLALIGPFGTDSATIGQRLVYWLTVAEAGTVIGIGVSFLVSALIDPQGRRRWWVLAASALAMTPVVSGVVALVTAVIFPSQRFFADFLSYLGPVLVISAAISAVNTLAGRTPATPATSGDLIEAPGSPAPPPVAEPARFLDRLPARLRGADLHAVEAEDHYLRLHTSRGSDLILMRLSDAIAELDRLEGARTHRSWWVARAAVTAVRKGDGRATLVLTNGVEAPVSRSYLPELRAQGWV